MSENYQSRVFTFINKRTNQLKNTCAQGLRHLKVAVVWSGQILLYPLQLLAQTTKIFQPQFSAHPARPSLPQPTSDINIEQALDLVAGSGYPISIDNTHTISELGTITDEDAHFQHFSPRCSDRESKLTFAAETSWNIEHSNTDPEDWELVNNAHKSRQVITRKTIIRGLSSLLIDRQLVLVTTENELLEILTLSQQQEIRRRIGIDLAIDWYQWHRGELAQSQLPSEHLSENRHQINNQLSTSHLEIAGTDTKYRNLASPKSLTNPIEKLRQHWHNWFQKITAESSEPKDSIPSPSLRELPSANYLFTPQPPQISRFLDLPQLPPIVETETLQSQDRQIPNSLVRWQPDWLKQWWNYYRDYFYIPSKHESQIVAQAEDFQLIPFQESSKSNRAKNATSIEQVSKKIDIKDISRQGNLTLRERENTSSVSSVKLSKRISEDLEYQPDWIEAESETIGYNRSPIAKFLAWLDRIFLEIENWLIKIWQAITNSPTQI